MKELKSPTMRALLKRALRQIKHTEGRPSEGTLWPLFTKDLPNGWYYQADYIYDSRCYKKPYVAIWAFRPPRNYCARSADYTLQQEIP